MPNPIEAPVDKGADIERLSARRCYDGGTNEAAPTQGASTPSQGLTTGKKAPNG